MTSHRSIGFRLTGWYIAILAGTLGLAGAGVWFGIRKSINETADRDLRSRIPAVRAYVDRQFRRGGKSRLAKELDEESMGAAPAGLQIIDSEGNWVYRSPAAKNWSWTPTPRDKLPQRGIGVTLRANGR